MASNRKAREIRRIGFLADTHIRKNDGSDLPQQVLDAFAGVDLIVHLGDIGKKVVLDCLASIAPVLVPAGDDKGFVPAESMEAEPIKVLEAGGVSIGMVFNITKPDKAILVGENGLQFGVTPMSELLRKRFRRTVDVVATGGTHRQNHQLQDGVLFFDPGSPTLPADKRSDSDLGGVAVLDVSSGKPRVELIRLSKRS